MKYIILSLMLAAFVACAENTAETHVKIKGTDSEAGTSEITPSQKKDKLVGTWYVKEVLIDGQPDPENFPVNNDEITFNQDMSVRVVDKTDDFEELGTWERISPEKFAIITEEERVVFLILKLTDKELDTKIESDEMEMVIKFRKEK